MRKIIAALQVSLDGFIEGPNEELDWVSSWEDPFDVVGRVDALTLHVASPAQRLADVRTAKRHCARARTRTELDSSMQEEALLVERL